MKKYFILYFLSDFFYVCWSRSAIRYSQNRMILMFEKRWGTLKREGCIIEGMYLILILVRDCVLVRCILITLYIIGKVMT